MLLFERDGGQWGDNLGASGSATIHNIDSPPPVPIDPAVTVSNASPVDEGQCACFTLTLSQATDHDVSVSVNTSDGSARANENYAPLDSVAIIPAGRTTALVYVQTLDYGVAEPDECFSLNVTGANGAALSGGLTASAMLLNIHFTPSVSGPSAVAAGSSYVLGLSAGHPGGLTIDHWSINWGDGQTQAVQGNPSSVLHSYAAIGQYPITAVAFDSNNQPYVASPGAGGLDVTTGVDGLTTVGLGADDPACITFSVVDSSGRIVVGGSVANGGYQLSRYLAGDVLDPGFGGEADALRCRRRARISLLASRSPLGHKAKSSRLTQAGPHWTLNACWTTVRATSRSMAATSCR